MSIKDTPEHPVACPSTGLPLRHGNNRLSMVVFNWIVARQLHQIIAHDALPTINQIRLLIPPQLGGGLLGRKHLDDATAVVASDLGYGALADDGARMQLVGPDH